MLRAAALATLSVAALFCALVQFYALAAGRLLSGTFCIHDGAFASFCGPKLPILTRGIQCLNVILLQVLIQASLDLVT